MNNDHRQGRGKELTWMLDVVSSWRGGGSMEMITGSARTHAHPNSFCPGPAADSGTKAGDSVAAMLLHSWVTAPDDGQKAPGCDV